MVETTEIEFDQAWSVLMKETKKSNDLVRNYFQNKLLPAFKAHSSIWILKSAGVANPENGITNNPSESMNAVLHGLQNWKQVPLDSICFSLFHLCMYYHKEIERGFHQIGSWAVKDEFGFMQREPSLMPRMSRVIDPHHEIVRRGRGDLSFQIEEKSNNCDHGVVKPSTSNTSKLALAHDAML